MSLGCTVIVYPTVKRYTPDVLWYRDSTYYTPEVSSSALHSPLSVKLWILLFSFCDCISRVTLHMETIFTNTEGPHQNHVCKNSVSVMTVLNHMALLAWLCYSDVLLKPSKWVHMHWSGEKATLTLVHLNKEDEGLYTLRINTKSGFETHSAYVFVKGNWSGWGCSWKHFLLLTNPLTKIPVEYPMYCIFWMATDYLSHTRNDEPKLNVFY